MTQGQQQGMTPAQLLGALAHVMPVTAGQLAQRLAEARARGGRGDIGGWALTQVDAGADTWEAHRL